MFDFTRAEQALEGLRKLHIGTDRDAEVATHIKRLLAKDGQGNLIPVAKRTPDLGETRGFMLTGEPGSGKSHLVERTLRKLSVLQPREDGTPRCLQSSVPSPATFKSMILQLLKESGYPNANPRKENWSLVQDLRYRLELLEISVIWIDEAQDLFCAERKFILRALKSLMQGDGAVAVILSGTEELSEVIRSDSQVKRRFTAMTLPGMVEQVDGASFQTILTQYCQRVGLDEPHAPDLIGRIFHGARYRFGRSIELLLMAMEVAIDREEAQLTVDHFAVAYAMNESCGASENVFYAEHYWLIETDPKAEERSPRGRKRNR
ncbi:transposase [Thioclava sp. SK-1]|uniref:ATP-binding protein n=1 Tax=Thioclava sp. SK-1 TaxID=1889770 RepID=UPI00082523A0|nr:ATP-binding protein [Thioclava sp. SK-1]OCX57381.1 transposase [Thioclava sp. SK-1]